MAIPIPLRPDAVTFGPLLRALRVRAALSQNRLAREAGVDPAYVNRLERATPETCPQPRREIVLALASSLSDSTHDRERLLVAAGHCPQVIFEAGGWDAFTNDLFGALMGVVNGRAEREVDACVRPSTSA